MNVFDEGDACSSFARKIQVISRITAGWAGHSVHTVVCQMDAPSYEGDLTVGLVGEDEPYTPVWLHLARIRYLRMEDFQETGPSFIDGIQVSVLPAPRSDWPAEARIHALRGWEGKGGEADLECEMAWVAIAGPWNLEAIAQIINVSVTPPELTNMSA
ncbi:hypothetical protein ACFT9I_07600 [Streptomyces sp. NPDC057137]|uniref:hypothetical protein n=1 Tax=Streptomyces sp. NPDC057137 TaxID=3346030 RepID=UPI00362BEBD5